MKSRFDEKLLRWKAAPPLKKINPRPVLPPVAIFTKIMIVSYSNNKISCIIVHSCMIPISYFQNALAYFAAAVSYAMQNVYAMGLF
jgi:hypothetical protein